MATKHTPTPWHVGRKFNGVLIGGHPHAAWEIIGPSPVRMGVAVCILPFEDLTDDSKAECVANAAFIVKAVNAHDALVAALKAVRDEFDARYDGAPDSRVLWMGPLMREIDAALKLAGEPAESEDL